MTQPTYWDYLRLDELLSLQTGLEGDESRLMTDELHFIVVHQVYELWFKLILRELRLARDQLLAPAVAEEKIPYVVHHLRRVSEILKLMVHQWTVMETLTPQDFLAFRDKLVPASGFQSFQMRALELVLGLSPEERTRYGGLDPVEHLRALAAKDPAGRHARVELERAESEASVRDALHEWLARTPIQGSRPEDPGDEETVGAFLDDYLRAHAAAQNTMGRRLLESGVLGESALGERLEGESRRAAAFLRAEDADAGERGRVRRIRAGLLFIESYRDLPLLAWPRLLIDAVVEVEEQFVLWRHRHARMTERTIGRRTGTGGSSGVDYLDAAARTRIFPELWAVRTLLLPREALPPLLRPEFYGFAV